MAQDCIREARLQLLGVYGNWRTAVLPCPETCVSLPWFYASGKTRTAYMAEFTLEWLPAVLRAATQSADTATLAAQPMLSVRLGGAPGTGETPTQVLLPPQLVPFLVIGAATAAVQRTHSKALVQHRQIAAWQLADAMLLCMPLGCGHSVGLWDALRGVRDPATEHRPLARLWALLEVVARFVAVELNAPNRSRAGLWAALTGLLPACCADANAELDVDALIRLADPPGSICPAASVEAVGWYQVWCHKRLRRTDRAMRAVAETVQLAQRLSQSLVVGLSLPGAWEPPEAATSEWLVLAGVGVHPRIGQLRAVTAVATSVPRRIRRYGGMGPEPRRATLIAETEARLFGTAANVLAMGGAAATVGTAQGAAGSGLAPAWHMVPYPRTGMVSVRAALIVAAFGTDAGGEATVLRLGGAAPLLAGSQVPVLTLPPGRFRPSRRLSGGDRALCWGSRLFRAYVLQVLLTLQRGVRSAGATVVLGMELALYVIESGGLRNLPPLVAESLVSTGPEDLLRDLDAGALASGVMGPTKIMAGGGVVGAIADAEAVTMLETCWGPPACDAP